MLAFAYAVFEEAFTTQTLFNPDYLHLNLHLLQPAYIPSARHRRMVDHLRPHPAYSVEHFGFDRAGRSVCSGRATTPWLGWRRHCRDSVFCLFWPLSQLPRIRSSTDALLAHRDRNSYRQPSFVHSRSSQRFVCRRSNPTASRMDTEPMARRCSGADCGFYASYIVPRAWGWLAVGIYVVWIYSLIVADFSPVPSRGWRRAPSGSTRRRRRAGLRHGMRSFRRRRTAATGTSFRDQQRDCSRPPDRSSGELPRGETASLDAAPAQ